jgi:hypothetical protein
MFWQKLRSRKSDEGVRSDRTKFAMKTNVGSYDAAVRFIAGCVLLLMGNHGLGVWGFLGLLPILSSITGFCVVYALFHIDTTACDHHDAPL